MLFPYIYISHDMEKMQEYMDYIFYEVWYKAIYTPEYNLNLFDDKPELKEILTDFFYNHSEGGDLFCRSIEEIFYICQRIPSSEMNQLHEWYKSNNNIEQLCQNSLSCEPITYKELKEFNEELHGKIKKLFTNLYGKKIIGRKAITDKIGKIDAHYDSFMRVNKTGICPFCGLHSIKGIYHTKREAYDHFLPKGTYPFNAINFKNLAPMCHECNSSYKLEKNPLQGVSGKRKAFYPYSSEAIDIDIQVTLNLSLKDEIKPENIEIEFISGGYEEEIETWKALFSIDERFKAICSSESDGLDWLEQINDDIENYEENITKTQILETFKKAKNRKPFADKRFLKVPFLEACKEKGLIDD